VKVNVILKQFRVTIFVAEKQ